MYLFFFILIKNLKKMLANLSNFYELQTSDFDLFGSSSVKNFQKI